MTQEWTRIVLLVTVVVATTVTLSGWITMLLWNWIIVGLFGAREVTFWEGVGVALCLGAVGSCFKSVTKERE